MKLKIIDIPEEMIQKYNEGKLSSYILDGFKKGVDTRPLIIRLVGQITDLDYMYSGDIVIENKNNASSYITLEGVGDDAVADGGAPGGRGRARIARRPLDGLAPDPHDRHQGVRGHVGHRRLWPNWSIGSPPNAGIWYGCSCL